MQQRHILESIKAKVISPFAEARENPKAMSFASSEIEPQSLEYIALDAIHNRITARGKVLRNELTPIIKEMKGKQAQLSPQVLIAALLPRFNNDIVQTVAAIAVATQEDADLAIKEGEPLGMDPLVARSKKSELNNSLRGPDRGYVDPNHSGTIYHYYGYLLRELTGGIASKITSSVTTNWFEWDDPDQYKADYSGRLFAQALTKAVGLSLSPAQLKQECEKLQCPLCE